MHALTRNTPENGFMFKKHK